MALEADTYRKIAAGIRLWVAQLKDASSLEHRVLCMYLENAEREAEFLAATVESSQPKESKH